MQWIKKHYFSVESTKKSNVIKQLEYELNIFFIVVQKMQIYYNQLLSFNVLLSQDLGLFFKKCVKKYKEWKTIEQAQKMMFVNWFGVLRNKAKTDGERERQRAWFGIIIGKAIEQ